MLPTVIAESKCCCQNYIVESNCASNLRRRSSADPLSAASGRIVPPHYRCSLSLLPSLLPLQPAILSSPPPLLPSHCHCRLPHSHRLCFSLSLFPTWAPMSWPFLILHHSLAPCCHPQSSPTPKQLQILYLIFLWDVSVLLGFLL